MTDAGVNTQSASRRAFDLVLRQSEIWVLLVADSFRELQCQWLPDIVERDCWSLWQKRPRLSETGASLARFREDLFCNVKGGVCRWDTAINRRM
jgi:hypothetical protein